MVVTSILISIICTLSCVISDSDDQYLLSLKGRDARLDFKLWQLEHGKGYETEIEEEQRFQVFRKNLKLIAQLNEEHQGSAVFRPNKFADISPVEFGKTVLMRRRSTPVHAPEKYLKVAARDDPLPDSFDWRDKGVVTPVKDQGSAGTCWAFSTVANVESQFALKYQKVMNLSVEQVVDCDDSEDIPKNYGDCGVYGGWPYLAFQYLERQGGIEAEDSYPYCAGTSKNTCFVCPNGPWNDTICGPPMPYCNMSQSCPYKLKQSKFVPGLSVKDWKILNMNETIIAQQLMEVGPFSVALDATMLQFYHSGVFNPIICSKTQLDHAVLMVGFGIDSGIFGKKPYWTIKNSWGPDWGEKGYFRIKRGDGTCGINTQVTTAVLG